MFLQSKNFSPIKGPLLGLSSDFYSIIITLFLTSAEKSSGCSFSRSYQKWLSAKKMISDKANSDVGHNLHQILTKKSRGQGVNDIFTLLAPQVL